MDNKIMKELKFNAERGSLFYNEVRYLLIRPETLAAFQKGIEKEMGEKASRILFESGFQGGSLSSKKYREIFAFSDEEIVHFMAEMGSQIGWGRFELEKFDSAQKRLVLKVYHSPFAEAYGSSSKPICHMIRGVLGGVASVIFGREVQSRELYCLAKGDECCWFEIT